MRVGLLHLHYRDDSGVLDEQCKARANKAVSLLRKGKIDQIYFTVPKKRGDELAHAMCLYLTGARVPRKKIVIAACGGNTLGEIESCAARLARGDSVVSISSWYHLPRILCIWLLRGRLVNLAASAGGNFIDIALEPFKFGYALVKWGRLF